jgi:hypothetical protein
MSPQPFVNSHFHFTSASQTASPCFSPSPLNSPASNAIDTVLPEKNLCASDGDAFQIIILVSFPCCHSFVMRFFSVFVSVETASIWQFSLFPT